MFHIVVCDDDRSITEYLKETLEKKYRRKIECQCVYSAEELLKWLEDLDQGHTNIIILDIALGDDDGIAIAKEIRSKYPQIKVILLSGYAQLASNVFEADPVYFLSKPIDEQKLFSSVEKAMDIVQHQEIKAITVAGSGGKIHRIKVSSAPGWWPPIWRYPCRAATWPARWPMRHGRRRRQRPTWSGSRRKSPTSSS